MTEDENGEKGASELKPNFDLRDIIEKLKKGFSSCSYFLRTVSRLIGTQSCRVLDGVWSR